MVWAAITSSSVVGPIFFDSKVNQHIYLDVIVNQFIPKLKALNNNQIDHLIFQQDSTRPHVTKLVLNKLNEFFGENLITKDGLTEWPTRSPDLTPCDNFLWGYLKGKLYGKRFDKIEELKKELIEEFKSLNENKDLLKKSISKFYQKTSTLYW